MRLRFATPLRLATLSLCLALPVQAAVFDVDNSGDDVGADCAVAGMCTLRAAVAASQANGVDDLIRLTQGQTYTLFQGTNPGLDITEPQLLEVAVFSGGQEVTSPFDTAIDGAGKMRHFIVRSGAILDLRGMTLRNGVVNANARGGAVAIITGGTGFVSDAIVTGNEAGDGGGLQVNDTGSLTLTRVAVSGNVVTNTVAEGGGIWNEGILTLVDTTVSGNNGDIRGTLPSGTNLIRGGGIYNGATATLSMTRGAVVWNHAGDLGGGIYTEGPVTPVPNQIVLTDVAVSGNHSDNAGGGLHNENASLVLDGVTVLSNTSIGDGGGIRHEVGAFTMLDSLVRENSVANLKGGGIALGSAGATEIMSITNSQILSNTALGANGDGGGISVVGGAPTVNVTDSLIDGNQAAVDGAGIFGIDGTVNVLRSRITNNMGTTNGVSDGGGMYITGATNLSVTESDISFNTARLRGGGILLFDAPSLVRIVDSNISDNQVINTTNGDGGGMRIQNSQVRIVRSTLARNSTDDDGAAIAVTQSGPLTSVEMFGSTVSANTANNLDDDTPGVQDGAAIAIFTGVAFSANNSTFAANVGANGGAEVFGNDGILNLFNNLIEHDPTDGENVCGEAVDSSDFNISESGTGLASCSLGGANDQTFSEANLQIGPLQYNGGPFGLHTHALGTAGIGSLAIDMADDTLCTGGGADADNALDNRSGPRSVTTTAGGCDAGAFEVGAASQISGGRLSIMGTAQGATPGVSVTIAGVTVNLDTSNGESMATVAANLAAAIMADPTLGALVQVIAIGSDVLIDDAFQFGSAPDAGLGVTSSDFAGVPLLGPAGIGILLALLPMTAAHWGRRPGD